MTVKYLTPDGYQKLIEELEHLRSVRRKEVADRLHTAVEEGNKMAEDPEYEAAKNEQAFIEGRILDLEILMAQARVVEQHSFEEARVGATVTIQEDGTDPETYILVGAAEANPREGRVSDESPLGKALLGHKEGDAVEVSAPSGTFTVKIVKIE